MPNFPSLAGRLLLAMPGIGDPRFAQAVVLVCSHGPEHAMGIRLDCLVPEVTLADILGRLSIGEEGAGLDRAVLQGGPVERERGFVLHTADFETDSTLPILDGVSLTATREILEALVDPLTAPERAVLALGYAGWGEGQLEEEMLENAWLTAEPDMDILFDDEHATKWSRAVSRIGFDAGRLSGQAGRA